MKPETKAKKEAERAAYRENFKKELLEEIRGVRKELYSKPVIKKPYQYKRSPNSKFYEKLDNRKKNLRLQKIDKNISDFCKKNLGYNSPSYEKEGDVNRLIYIRTKT